MNFGVNVKGILIEHRIKNLRIETRVLLLLLPSVERWGINCYDEEVHCRPLQVGISKAG